MERAHGQARGDRERDRRAVVSRRRAAAVLVVGLLLGFFAGVAAIGLRHDAPAPPTSSAGAAAVSAAKVASTNYGAMQAQQNGVVTLIHTLRVGSNGDGVKQLQEALVRAGVRPAKSKATGHYGVITGREVSAFQKRVGIKASGVYGRPTLLKLSRYYTPAMRGELAAIAHAHYQADRRNGILHGVHVYAVGAIAGRAHYSEGVGRSFLPSLPSKPGQIIAPSYLDCSAYVTWLFKVSGVPTSGLTDDLPDPSGFGYRVIGYTGTLAQHGTRIPIGARLKVGDLVFYGGGYPYSHVAVVVNAMLRLVSSHGQPGVRTVPFNYRPVAAIRRYF